MDFYISKSYQRVFIEQENTEVALTFDEAIEFAKFILATLDKEPPNKTLERSLSPPAQFNKRYTARKKQTEKCPICEKEMQEWFTDVDQDNIPTAVDLIGYGCQECRLTFIDLNKSWFDGFVYDRLLTYYLQPPEKRGG